MEQTSAVSARVPRPKRPSRELRWSVRTRLMVAICVIVALGITAAGSSAFLIERQNALTALDAHLRSRVEAARSIVLGASNVEEPGASPVAFSSARAAVRAVVAGVVPDTHESTVAIVNGKAAYTPGVLTAVQFAGMSALVKKATAQTARGGSVFGNVVTVAGTYRYIAVPITVVGSKDRATFVMGASIDAALAGVYGQASTFALVSLVTFLIVVALGWFVSGRLLWPIVLLTRTAERITSRNRSERVATRGGDDLSRLGRVVNSMLDRLDAELTRQRQLLDDVRHELNTPLTIVRGHLELLDAHNPDDVFATKALSMDELSRMSELVSDLTRLAESENSTLDLVAADVGDLARSVHAKASVLPDHEWILGDVDEGVVTLDVRRVTEAWLQLLENAAKYSPPSTAITLGATASAGEWEFWVIDEGPGVPADAQERIFERFGRVDSSRGVQGSGLGLPIVRAIARAHGGEAAMEPHGDGSRFSITVPATADDRADVLMEV